MKQHAECIKAPTESYPVSFFYFFKKGRPSFSTNQFSKRLVYTITHITLEARIWHTESAQEHSGVEGIHEQSIGVSAGENHKLHLPSTRRLDWQKGFLAISWQAQKVSVQVSVLAKMGPALLSDGTRCQEYC